MRLPMFVFWFLLAVANGSCLAQTNTALLIAVSEYEHVALNEPRLRYPEADAEAVGELLASKGYQVELMLGSSATKAAIEQRLTTLRASATGTLVIGFWGHGVQFSEEEGAMFCPFDCRMRTVKDKDDKQIFEKNGLPSIEPDPETLVRFTTALSSIKLSGAGHGLVLSDYCRDAPYRARSAFGSGYTSASLPKNTALIFGCSENQKAFEDDSLGHGAFTYCLLELLRTPPDDYVDSITGTLQEKVLALVRDKTNGREQQEVNPITNGVTRLGLTGNFPPGQVTRSTGDNPIAAQAVSKNFALLIGINEFQSPQIPKLEYCESDATKIAEFLETVGYETKLLLGRDASQKEIKAALTDLAKRGTKDSTCLIGLFGHGVESDNTAYFFTQDATLREAHDAEGKRLRDQDGNARMEPNPESLIAWSDVVQAIHGCGAGSRVSLFDTIRNEPTRARSFGNQPGGLDIPINSAFIFSCSTGEQSFESTEFGGGLFARSFLEASREAVTANKLDVTAGEIASAMKRSVDRDIKKVTNEPVTQTVHPIINGSPVFHFQPSAKR